MKADPSTIKKQQQGILITQSVVSERLPKLCLFSSSCTYHSVKGTRFDFGLDLRSATYDLGQVTQPLNPAASSIKSTRMPNQPQ